MRSPITLNRNAWLVLGLGLGCTVGCLVTRPDPNHCFNLDGDETCAARHPGQLTFCSACEFTPSGDGCVAERPEDAACHSPCGGRTRADDDDSCLVGMSSSSGEETSTGEETTSGTDTDTESESSTTGPVPCMGNEDCPDAAAPLCEPVSGECVRCDAFGAEADAACAGLDPMAPLCVDGACVACTPENPVVCDDQLLLCDGGTNTCIQCTEHAQCGSGACELDVGLCFPDDFVVHVDGDPTAMPMPDYTSITAAVAAVDDGTHGVIVVHELDMAASYQAAVTIDGGKTIALLAAPGEAPRIQGTAGSPGLRVQGAGTVLYADGLNLRSGDALGLEVNGAFAWVDRSRIVQNSGGGIVAQNAAELTLRNCFVGGNVEAVVLDVVGATAEVLYTTLGAGLGVTTGLRCDPAASAVVRNSLIVSRSGDDEVVCTGLTASNTASEMLIDGTDNVALGDMDTTWFVDFNAGDFSLTAMHPADIDTAALWTEGDPPTDIDGDLRPTNDGDPDYAGADVP